FFFQAEDGIRDFHVTGVQTCALPISMLTVGLRMGIGPFFLPITHDLGFSRSMLAGIIAVGMLFYGIAMPFAGHLVATRGTRFVRSEERRVGKEWRARALRSHAQRKRE